MEALKKKYHVPDETLQGAVRISGGNYVKAQEYLLAGEDSASQLDQFIRIMRLSWSREFGGIFF